MSDENQPHFNLQRIYTKDISFETPNSPGVFLADWKPEMDMKINTEVNKIDDNNYEVVLVVTVTVKSDGKTAFLAEVHQAGIFTVANIPDEQMGPIMGIQCPVILFPYAREAVSDLVNRGSFPQLLLAPVNFEQLYVQHMEQQAKANGEQPH